MQIFIDLNLASFFLLKYNIFIKIVNDQEIVLILHMLPLQIELILDYRIQKLVLIVRETIFLIIVKKSYCMRAFIEFVLFFNKFKVLAKIIDDVFFDVLYAQEMNRNRWNLFVYRFRYVSLIVKKSHLKKRYIKLFVELLVDRN